MFKNDNRLFANKKRNPKQKIKSILLFTMGFLLLPSAVLAQPTANKNTSAQVMTKYQFDIAPQSLITALMKYTRLTSIDLVYDGAIVQDMKSKGVKGEYTSETGLKQLLDGTGLIYRFTNETTVTLKQVDTLNSDGALLGQINIAGTLVTEEEPGNFLLDDQRISQIQASSVSDLLANESSIAVGGGSSVNHKIYVRGFEDTMVNVVIDGAQQIGELYHHQGRVQLEPEFIKSVVLDAGAGAATNGPGGLTGTMHVTNKDAFDMLRDDQDFGAYVKGVAGFNGEDSLKGVFSLYGRTSENTGLIFAFSRQNSDDYEDGNGNIVSPTAFDHERGYIKFNGEFDWHEMSITYENIHDYGTYFERPNLTNFRGTYILSDHELNRQTLSFNHRYDPKSDLLNIKTTVYTTNSDYQNQRTTTGARYGEGDFTSTGFDVRNTSEFGQHAFTYGIDYRHDDLRSEQNATPPPYWGFTEQSLDVFGVYAQDNWVLNDELLLSFGLRYDDYDHQVDAGVSAGVSNKDSGLSPNVSLAWEVADGLTIRPAYAKAFRGITIREAFFSAIYVHDGTLEPEEADNLELGIAYEKDGFFTRATVYRQNIENYIDAVFTGGAVWGYWRNVGDAEVDGYELEIGKHWKNMRFSFGVWDAETKLNDQPLTDGNLGLGTNIGRTWITKFDYAMPQHHLDFSFVGRYVESEENYVASTAPDKESYFDADVHVKWQPNGDDSMTAGFSINNVFDDFYYDHATYTYIAGTDNTYVGYPEKGREYLLSFAYKF